MTQELLDRLVLDRVLLAGVEIVVWLVAPVLIVLALAGLGAWTVRAGAVRHGDGLLALAWAAVSGAVLVIGAVAGLNLFAPVPRWSPVAVVALGAVGLVRSARRLALTPRVVVRLSAVMGGTAGLYRVGYSPLTYDAFLYHGVIVEWLGREAVPQGFGLLHSRFAFNPGLALLMPAFRSGGTDWTHHVLVELAVVGLVMVVLVALLSAARDRGDGPLAALLLALSFASALFLVLRQRGPGTDLAVAFTLVAATGVAAALLRGEVATRGPGPGRPAPERAGLFALLGMLAAFAILQKVSAAAVLVLLLAPVLARRASPAVAPEGGPTDARALPFVLPSLVLALVAGVLHTARTFVMSGCLAYPVAATCIERPWTIGPDVASAESATIRSWARDRSGAHPDLLDVTWVADWTARYVRDETFVVLALGVAFGLLGHLLRLRRRTVGDAVAVEGRRDGLLWASVGVSALLWAVSAPGPRFGIHLHLVTAALLAAPAAERLLERVDRVPGAAERATASVWRPSAAAVVGVAAVLGAFGVGMIAEGRQLPVSGSVPHPMRTVAMSIAGSTDGWDYLAPVGSDQCGDAFPCAPSERDLVVDVSGPRLAFKRSAG